MHDGRDNPTPPGPPVGPPAAPLPLLPRPPWHKRMGRWLVAAIYAIPGLLKRGLIGVERYFGERDPRIVVAMVPFLALALVIYMRDPRTNYIFDEQEALLANPYVNAKKGLEYWDAIHVDFWGLPPDASIGSYRPIPDLLWRALWQVSEHPFFHHFYNIIVHALNGALMSSFVLKVSGRRRLAWLTGFIFLGTAVLTEAVSGIVGIADVLGGLGAILALCALRLPAAWMPVGVFAALTFGLFSKESALVCVPLVPVVALLTAPLLHPERPARVPRAVLSLLAALAAFVLYVELRREWFPSPLPGELSEPLPLDAGALQELHRALMVWFHQAPLPKDPLNNPLVKADFPHRVAAALRVYWRGFVQVLFPLRLSGDYSFPQEPVPETLDEWETIAGGLLMIVPPAAALGLALVAWLRERRDRLSLVPAGPLADALGAVYGSDAGDPGRGAPLIELPGRPWRRRLLGIASVLVVAGLSGLGTEIVLMSQGAPTWVHTWPYSVALLLVGLGFLVDGWPSPERAMTAAGPWPYRHLAPIFVAIGGLWMVVSYFPHSNIPVVLPTVRAERFWYFPVIGTSLPIALLFDWLMGRTRGRRLGRLNLPALLFGTFFSFQCLRAYDHAMDYENDLVFWHATMRSVPNSAKAHLNYSVMVGARGDLETRLRETHVARKLAPEWPMAHIYTGDTLCRMKRADEAWPYYKSGFAVGPNERSLIALALQCMWDQKIVDKYADELRTIADEHPGSWIAYLAIDIVENGKEHKGVDPKYRPRGYNQGPKDE